MTSATRIYLVSTRDSARLVKAAVPSQAITHVAKQIFSVRIASQEDLIEELGRGTPVETYGETSQKEFQV